MTIRIALALLVIVPAAMAYPWETNTSRWLLGAAAVVVLVLFAWWRGQFVTTMIDRRVAIWRRNHSKPRVQKSNRATVLLRIDDPDAVGLSLPLVAGYVERFGVRCERVRVISRDDRATRATWVGMTLDAADNLVALQARSPHLPLLDTAEIVGRRLADHLRESGVSAVIVDDAPTPLAGPGRERWRGVQDDRGWASAYSIPVDQRLAERLTEVRAQATETWTALEFSGTSAHPTIAVLCVVRTADPVRGTPLPGLKAHPGSQGSLLAAMDPVSAERLGIPRSPLPPGLLERVGWPVGSALATQT